MVVLSIHEQTHEHIDRVRYTLTDPVVHSTKILGLNMGVTKGIRGHGPDPREFFSKALKVVFA